MGPGGGDALTSYSEPDNIDVREAGSLATGHWHLQPPGCTLPAPALESVGVKAFRVEGFRLYGFVNIESFRITLKAYTRDRHILRNLTAPKSSIEAQIQTLQVPTKAVQSPARRPPDRPPAALEIPDIFLLHLGGFRK